MNSVKKSAAAPDAINRIVNAVSGIARSCAAVSWTVYE